MLDRFGISPVRSETKTTIHECLEGLDEGTDPVGDHATRHRNQAGKHPAVNPQPDDLHWLRRIGVTTAATDRADPAGDGTDIIDLDADPTDLDATANDDSPAPTPERFTPWVAAVFGAVALVATAATAGAAALTARDPAPAGAAEPSLMAHPPVAALPTNTPQSADSPIPFTASADCPPGSTAAQSVADPRATAAWICARSVDGQVLRIDLGRAYVITAVSIVPGAITGSDDQSDPWSQHRVVTRIQWQFNDVDKTVRNQNTGDVRGEAVLGVPNVLASAITVIIQQTSRPPAIAPTTTPAQPPADGVLGPILGSAPTEAPSVQLPDEPPPPDPSDGTFAVTTIKVIGHKAI